MRALLQRVTKSKVTVGDRLTGEIGAGLVILLGVGAQDTDAELELLVNKIANLRIFTDGCLTTCDAALTLAAGLRGLRPSTFSMLSFGPERRSVMANSPPRPSRRAGGARGPTTC